MAAPSPPAAKSARFDTASLGAMIKLAHNMTPHDVAIFDASGEEVYRLPKPANAAIARVDEQEPATRAEANIGDGKSVQLVVGLPVPTGHYPETLPDAPIVVSEKFAEYLLQRDLFHHAILVPMSGPGYAVRDEKGQIVGTKGLRVMQLEPISLVD